MSLPGEAAPGSPRSPEPGARPYRYRLSMVDRDGRRRDLAPIYPTVDDAVEVADHLLRMLEHRPAKRPQYLTVFDMWTGEVMRTRRPSDVAGTGSGPFDRPAP